LEIFTVGSFSGRERIAIRIHTRWEWLSILIDGEVRTRRKWGAIRSNSRRQKISIRSNRIESAWGKIFAIGTLSRSERLVVGSDSGKKWISILIDGISFGFRKRLAIRSSSRLGALSIGGNWVEATRRQFRSIGSDSGRKRFSVSVNSGRQGFVISSNGDRIFRRRERLSVGSVTMDGRAGIDSDWVVGLGRDLHTCRSDSWWDGFALFIDTCGERFSVLVDWTVGCSWESLAIGSSVCRKGLAKSSNRIECSRRESLSEGAHFRRQRFSIGIDAGRHWSVLVTHGVLLSRRKRISVGSFTVGSGLAIGSDGIEGTGWEFLSAWADSRWQRFSILVNSFRQWLTELVGSPTGIGVERVSVGSASDGSELSVGADWVELSRKQGFSTRRFTGW
jgi:hypothetical protein